MSSKHMIGITECVNLMHVMYDKVKWLKVNTRLSIYTYQASMLIKWESCGVFKSYMISNFH